jgi:hypothetical protein
MEPNPYESPRESGGPILPLRQQQRLSIAAWIVVWTFGALFVFDIFNAISDSLWEISYAPAIVIIAGWLAALALLAIVVWNEARRRPT